MLEQYPFIGERMKSSKKKVERLAKEEHTSFNCYKTGDKEEGRVLGACRCSFVCFSKKGSWQQPKVCW